MSDSKIQSDPQQQDAPSLTDWALVALRSNFQPQGQPTSVHQISSQLFAQYDFPTGHIHLAGCTLEDRPIVRLTLPRDCNDRDNGRGDERADEVRHQFFLPDGQRLEEALISALHLDNVAPCSSPPPHLSADELQASVTLAQAQLANLSDELIDVSLVWCKFAQGKLALEAGEECVTVPFAGWATLLAEGAIKPPPYHCPLTEEDTYRLGVTDDGRIVAAAGITPCDESGRRVLNSELEPCAATGKRVLPELLETCRASGQRVMASSMVKCSQCDQSVSPNSLKGGKCSLCRSLAPVRKDDPRMARLLDEFPKLDRWPRWRIAETDHLYLLLAASWLRQLLMVVDKQSLEVLHIAASGRLFTNWVELSSGQREELLR